MGSREDEVNIRTVAFAGILHAPIAVAQLVCLLHDVLKHPLALLRYLLASPSMSVMDRATTHNHISFLYAETSGSWHTPRIEIVGEVPTSIKPFLQTSSASSSPIVPLSFQIGPWYGEASGSGVAGSVGLK